MFQRVGDDEWMARARCVIGELSTISGPVELRHALQVWPRLPTQRWNGPNAYPIVGSLLLANPKGDERRIYRETQSTYKRVHNVSRTPVRQIVKLSRADLTQPHIHRPIMVR